MKTIGPILKAARSECGLTLDEVARRTRIRVEFLQAIEDERFDALPKGPFAAGFIRTYAREVGLNPERSAAVYRRDFGARASSQLMPSGVVSPIRKHTWFSVTPQFVGALFIGLVIAGFLLFQISTLNQPPPLLVSEPQANQEVRSPVVVRGQTATDCVVRVQGQAVAVDQDGNFTTNVTLSQGGASITVDSTNRKGKTRVVQRSVQVVQ